MVLSMTGFALCKNDVQQGSLAWELRAVNQRFLDVQLRLPEEFRSLEEGVRARLKSRVVRGKMECTLRYHSVPSQSMTVNQSVVKALLNACSEVQSLLSEKPSLSVLEVLRWPGVMDATQGPDEVMKSEVMRLLDVALEAFIASRAREGSGLCAVIQQRCQQLEDFVRGARNHISVANEKLRQKVVQRVQEVASTVDGDRMEQELVYWAQRMDVSEELDRLEVHLTEVGSILEKEEPIGRRLDFIVQEMNREVNTLGAKSTNTSITKSVVDMKVLLEQIREQVQNVE